MFLCQIWKITAFCFQRWAPASILLFEWIFSQLSFQIQNHHKILDLFIGTPCDHLQLYNAIYNRTKKKNIGIYSMTNTFCTHPGKVITYFPRVCPWRIVTFRGLTHGKKLLSADTPTEIKTVLLISLLNRVILWGESRAYGVLPFDEKNLICKISCYSPFYVPIAYILHFLDSCWIWYYTCVCGIVNN